jgi:hypothetical protein
VEKPCKEPLRGGLTVRRCWRRNKIILFCASWVVRGDPEEEFGIAIVLLRAISRSRNDRKEFCVVGGVGVVSWCVQRCSLVSVRVRSERVCRRRVELQYFAAGLRVRDPRPLAHRCLSGFDVGLPRSV